MKRIAALALAGALVAIPLAALAAPATPSGFAGRYMRMAQNYTPEQAAQMHAQCIDSAADANRDGVSQCNSEHDGSSDPQGLRACLDRVRSNYDDNKAACDRLYQ